MKVEGAGAGRDPVALAVIAREAGCGGVPVWRECGDLAEGDARVADEALRVEEGGAVGLDVAGEAKVAGGAGRLVLAEEITFGDAGGETERVAGGVGDRGTGDGDAPDAVEGGRLSVGGRCERGQQDAETLHCGRGMQECVRVTPFLAMSVP